MIAMFDGKYAFLSNFYPSPFTVDGITYPTVEHWFQAWKCKTEQEHKAIAKAKSPGEAKRMGRHCSIRPDWEKIKASVMYDGLKHKFSDPVLGQMLLDTGDEELVEGNTWHDNTWGNCVCAKCTDIKGKNMLGLILTDVRRELRYGYGATAAAQNKPEDTSKDTETKKDEFEFKFGYK